MQQVEQFGADDEAVGEAQAVAGEDLHLPGARRQRLFAPALGRVLAGGRHRGGGDRRRQRPPPGMGGRALSLPAGSRD